MEVPSQDAGAVSKSLREGTSPTSLGVRSVQLSADVNLQLDPAVSHPRLMRVLFWGVAGEEP